MPMPINCSPRHIYRRKDRKSNMWLCWQMQRKVKTTLPSHCNFIDDSFSPIKIMFSPLHIYASNDCTKHSDNTFDFSFYFSKLNRFHKSNTCTNLERLIQIWIRYRNFSPHGLSYSCKEILNNLHLKWTCSLSSIERVRIYIPFVNGGIHTMFFTIYTPSFWSTFHRKWSVILVYYLLMFVLIEKHTH